MGRVRVVLYAEGAGEVSFSSLERGPGTSLLEEELGAAHLLLRRALEDGRSIPEAAVSFEEPLRLRRGGRIARGSDLLSSQRLRELLTWPANPPDLAVVLVDADGASDRFQTLQRTAADRSVPHAIGVAVQEFEAWLIADHAAVKRALGTSPSGPAEIETLPPGRAKETLTRWTAEAGKSQQEREVRITIARICDLTHVSRRCSAFAAFVADLSKR
jgi:hypothetical protein